MLHERVEAIRDAGTSAADALVLEWSEPSAVDAFADAVLSVFGPAAKMIESVGAGTSKVAADVARAIQWPRADRASLRLHLRNGSTIEFACKDTAVVQLTARATQPGVEWLQASAHLHAPLGVLCVPSAHASGELSFWRALVGIASRCGELSRAGLHRTGSGGEWTLASWSSEPIGEPLVSVALGTRFEGAAVAADSKQALAPLDGLRALLAQASPGEAVEAWLTQAVGGCRIRLGGVNFASTACSFRRLPTADACLFVVPQPDAVLLAVDAALPVETAAWALAHGLGHVVLGHVRPGDTHGHWDTRESFESPEPLHRWDRDVRSQLPAWSPPVPEKRSTLEECTPQEKAWLVLYDHIGRMVGESSVLHESVNRYRAAAYQRQAAQRLVAQLDQYGGSMLCDGVGLGKTYVATTAMAHYAARWLDRLRAGGRTPSEDPFRIAVLAPNSVVSTWVDEALPTLFEIGVPASWVRVVSHTKFQRMHANSALLAGGPGQVSDFEFIATADLVVVDEAHNFRSEGARRTSVLKELLRLQPRRDARRRVLLLTATPVNNGLEDLRQQAALMFSRPRWLGDANDSVATDYRAAFLGELARRVDAVRAGTRAAAERADGWDTLLAPPGCRISEAVEFDPQRSFGSQIANLDTYLSEEKKRLLARQASLYDALKTGSQLPDAGSRIAGALLDAIVVQRSRALCKQIELEQHSAEQPLFRRDAKAPERLVYEDSFGATGDLLARFLPLFATADGDDAADALSFRVYMWVGIRDNTQSVEAPSTVIGLQRIMALKRLESSPIAFLVTVLRLLTLHATCLDALWVACKSLGDANAESLESELSTTVGGLTSDARDALNILIGGESLDLTGFQLVRHWATTGSTVVRADKQIEDLPAQLDLFGSADDDAFAVQAEQLKRLLGLRGYLVADFERLLRTAPALAEIVFEGFERAAWPRRLVNGGETVRWPQSPTWGRRLNTDAKLRRLTLRLLEAQSDGQKSIVFSQFTDTVVYINSVIEATASFAPSDWSDLLNELQRAGASAVTEDSLRRFVSHTAWVAGGDRESRESTVDAFAPFYRLLPYRPRRAGLTNDEFAARSVRWEAGWRTAISNPIDVLFATDVLAEGVNLQDASLLVNYDIHWNPVRMIQRSGRIDRRLNPQIEESVGFPDVEAVASELGLPAPRYWWHANRDAPPAVANLLLTESLEDQLHLRERIATKSLTIDFTLGLEQGTGAEAEWMTGYKYRGISALNAWEGDRAIERVAGYQARLRRILHERTIEPEWVNGWSGWIRETDSPETTPLVAWTRLARAGGEVLDHTRRIVPCLFDGAVHWQWTTEKPASTLYAWLRVDGTSATAARPIGLPYIEDASRPISPDDLLSLSRNLLERELDLFEYDPESDVGARICQGAVALSRGYLPADLSGIELAELDFRILQIATKPAGGARRGIARACPVCATPPGMHKCCPRCSARADGEGAVEATFGFRRVARGDGLISDIPQTWCRACRSAQHVPSEESDA